MPSGLAPLSPAGPGQPIDTARPDIMGLLSDEAKALVLGELLDMRGVAQKTQGNDSFLVKWTDGAIRRVARGLYRYEMRRRDPAAPVVDFDPTEW